MLLAGSSASSLAAGLALPFSSGGKEVVSEQEGKDLNSLLEHTGQDS